MFSAAKGISPYAFLLHRRLQLVRADIQRGLPLADAVYAAGFFYQSHMSRRFKSAYGITPKQFQRAACQNYAAVACQALKKFRSRITMLKLTITTLLLALTVYLALCGLLYTMQRALLYFPTPAVSTPEAEVIWLKNANQTLKIWHIPGSSDKALIYFGGNAEDVALNIPQFKRLFPDHAVYLHNYRGYGGSTGTPTEEGLFADACALYDFVSQNHAHISVMGRSLGTGVAIYLATQRDVSRLVLVTPFDSMTNVASNLYPFFPAALLLRDKYNSLDRITGLNTRILILIAEHDEVIPRKHTDNLVAALSPELTRVKVIASTGHNTISDVPSYEKALSDFFARQ